MRGSPPPPRVESAERRGIPVPIRLIAIDIDGTLLDSRGQLPEANRAAVCDAVQAGIEVVLATGRNFYHAQPIAAALPDPMPLIVSNGALVKDTRGVTLDRRLLDRDIARQIVTATRPVRQGAALIFDRSGNRHYQFEGIDWQHPNRRHYFERNRQFMTEVTPLEDALTQDPAQVAFTGGVDDMRRLASFLRQQPIAQQVSITLTEYEDRDFSLLDVIVAGCSKGSSLAAWSAARGVDPAEVMAVGDNLNDQEMLEFAGWPVVMGNAVPELKALGWRTTLSHDEGGLADAIRALALPR